MLKQGLRPTKPKLLLLRMLDGGGRECKKKFTLRRTFYTQTILGSFGINLILPLEPLIMASSSTSQNQKTPAQPAQTLTRQEQEQATEDRTLSEFMLILDDYEPLVCPLHQLLSCHSSPQSVYRYPMKSQITIYNASASNARMQGCKTLPISPRALMMMKRSQETSPLPRRPKIRVRYCS